MFSVHILLYKDFFHFGCITYRKIVSHEPIYNQSKKECVQSFDLSVLYIYVTAEVNLTEFRDRVYNTMLSF